jgi:hypothetical protein
MLEVPGAARLLFPNGTVSMDIGTDTTNKQCDRRAGYTLRVGASKVLIRGFGEPNDPSWWSLYSVGYIVFHARGKNRNFCYGKSQQDVNFCSCRLTQGIWCTAGDKECS